MQNFILFKEEELSSDSGEKMEEIACDWRNPEIEVSGVFFQFSENGFSKIMVEINNGNNHRCSGNGLVQ